MAANGVLPFATPVTLDELWKNILYDLGLPIPGSKGGPVELKSILKLLDQGLSGLGAGAYGTGSDGVCNFISTGSVTVAGATLSSGTYTMTRDIYLADQSIVAAGSTIKTAGFRIFCAGHLYINGTIDSSGNASVANAAGGALSYSGTISNTTVGEAGAAGGTGNGSAGTAAGTNALGGAGGAGGASTDTAGAGGAVTAPAATVQGVNNLPNAIAVRVIGTTAFALCLGGAGGGAGGGDTTNNSGGGGGGGGIIMIAAQTISGTGTISCNGGAGGAANATGNSAGGGGGGGGAIILVSRTVTNVQPTVTAGVTTISGVTLSVAGGLGGAKTGTGGVGVAGSPGTMTLIAS
jgi:fibronectin-binding autotransporter adhesin